MSINEGKAVLITTHDAIAICSFLVVIIAALLRLNWTIAQLSKDVQGLTKNGVKQKLDQLQLDQATLRTEFDAYVRFTEGDAS